MSFLAFLLSRLKSRFGLLSTGRFHAFCFT